MSSKQGFSLIEALIVAGIFSIIALSMSSMFNQQQKEIQRLTVKSNLIDVQNSIRRALTDPAKCLFNMNSALVTVNNSSAAALAAHSFNFAAASAIIDGSALGAPKLISMGSANIALPKTTVTNITLSNWRASSATDYLADLSIQIEAPFGSIAPVTIANIGFTTAGGGLAAESITACTAGASGLGGSSPIIFSTGVVTELAGVSSRNFFLPPGNWMVNIITGIEHGAFLPLQLRIDGVLVYTAPGAGGDPPGTNWIPLIGTLNNVVGNRNITCSFNFTSPWGGAANMTMIAIKQ